jgi:hypothetical protein
MQRRIACPGSLALEEQEPDSSSIFADEGTAAHTLAAWTLDSAAKYTRAFMGRVIEVVNGDTKRSFEVDEDMCEHVQVYVDAIMARVEEYQLAGAVKVTLMVEQKVDFSAYVSEPNSYGTSDIIILVEWKDGTTLLDVEDLKYGMGVQVFAEKNEQMLTYALGAYDRHSLVENITLVRCVIHQPRLNHVDEYECTVEELLAFAKVVKDKTDLALFLVEFYAKKQDISAHLHPGEKQCKFCKAKATCPALRGHVFSKISGEIVDLDAPLDVPALVDQGKARVRHAGDNTAVLDDLYPHLDLIHDFVSGVLANIEARLFAGQTFKEVKLVEGKRGSRKWLDKDAVEKKLKSMRLKQEEMYDLKLISPTSAEKLLKKDAPRRWTSLQEFIGQSEGKPSVAPMSDKRPALVVRPISDEIADLGEDLV